MDFSYIQFMNKFKNNHKNQLILKCFIMHFMRTSYILNGEKDGNTDPTYASLLENNWK